jgi:hypothetical protein
MIFGEGAAMQQDLEMSLTITGRLAGGAWILRPAGAMPLGPGCEQLRERR